MKNLNRNALSVAVGAAVVSMAILPAAALAGPNTYELNGGVFTGQALSVTTVSAFDLKIVGDMTTIVNSGTISTNNGGSEDSAVTYEFGGSVDTFTNDLTGLIEVSLSDNTITRAAGIFIDDDFGSAIINNGTIDVDITSTISDISYAGGIYVNGAVLTAGSITNTGDINVDLVSADDIDTAGGIAVYSDMDGTITNDGSITFNATASSDIDDVGGIYVGGDLTTNGSIGNTGDITVTLNADSDIDTVGGIYVDGDVDGSISNSGDIIVNLVVGDDIDTVAGIGVDDDLSGSITNNGNITVIATADSGDMHDVAGILVDDDVLSTGSIINSVDSDINVTLDMYSDLHTAGGIVVHNDMDGSITNDGNIVFAATASEIDDAGGIFVGSGIADTGSIINNGSIDVDLLTKNTGASLSSPGISSVGGIYVDEQLDGSITNNGTIDLDATASDGYGIDYAGGIFVDSTVSSTGSISNTGIINVNLDATSGSVYSAGGIFVNGDLDGSIKNSGTINLDAYGDTGIYHVGGIQVYNGDVTGSITNDGEINVTLDGGTYDITEVGGIYLQSSDLLGSISNNGTINLTATATDDSISYIGGIYLTQTVTSTGSISNTGDIIVNLNADDDVDTAGGIYVNGDMAGSITNNIDGNITFNATASSDIDDVGGIYVDGDLAATGSISNTGDINVTLDAVSDISDAGGIAVSGDLDGSITNDGNIIFAATGSEIDDAGGIYVDDSIGVTGSIINNGSIDVDLLATSESMSSAGGIAVNDDVSGSITNNGSITVNATAESSNIHDVAGIFVDDAVFSTGSITNTGDINVTLNADDYIETAGGIVAHNTMDGTITNTGTITLNAVGSSVYSSVASISIGTLNGSVVNSGTITSSHAALYADSGTGLVSNASGGLVDGWIDLGGTVSMVNNGTIILPTDSSYIGGNFDQSVGGVLAIDVVDDGDYGTLNVSGTATLDAGTGITVLADPANTLADGDVLDDVISAGTLVDATSFNVLDNSLAFAFDAYDDGFDNVDIDVTATNLTTLLAAATAQNASAAEGLAAELDAQITADPYGDLAVQFGSLSTEKGVGDALESLTPMASAVVGGTQSATSAITREVTAAASRNATGIASGDVAMRGNAWFKAFGVWTDQDDRNGVTGYDADTEGLIIGVDTDLSTNWNAGIAFSYAVTDVDSTPGVGDQNADVDTYMGILYGSYQLDGATRINMQLGYGESDVDSKRVVLGGAVAKADYDSDTVIASVAIERSLAMNADTTMTPYLSASYSKVDVDDYSETGAGFFNLNVDSLDAESLILGVGAKLESHVSSSVTLLANAGIGYDTIADSSNVTASFAGGGSAFNVEGIEPDEITYNAGVGARFNLGNAGDVSVTYNIDGREDLMSQSAGIKYSLQF
ncbi:MAG: autotransporter domain-containing protein [Cycloclasticus sp.]|nr:autotransporter domain-containing protein [Cycloclasticus sp.]MBQ0789371.1 autotransporter domain-containing protein [Cycloclasticus sp.]